MTLKAISVSVVAFVLLLFPGISFANSCHESRSNATARLDELKEAADLMERGNAWAPGLAQMMRYIRTARRANLAVRVNCAHKPNSTSAVDHADSLVDRIEDPILDRIEEAIRNFD